MNEIKFYLKHPNDDNSLILMSYNFGGHRLRISTGHNVPVKYWNSNRMRVKSSMQFPQHILYNQTLDRFEESTKAAHRKLLDEKRSLNIRSLKNQIQLQIKGVPVKTRKANKSLHHFLDQYYQQKQSDQSLGRRTIYNYRKIIRLIKKYESSEHFPLSDIDKEFHVDFRSFLFDEGYEQGYISRLITSYKGIMQEAFSKGFIKDQSFSSKELSVASKETDSIYLNEENLDKLFQLDLSDNQRLDKVRDLFLIASYTGLRFNDVSQLNMDQILEEDGKSFLRVSTQKTNRTVVIPLRQTVLDVIDKYNGFPGSISNQKFNKYIKEVCQLAGLHEPITLRKYIKGRTIQETKEQWEMVSSHTARRSFATNAYLSGIPSIKIMKITGHRKESTFMKYIKIDELENAFELADSAFFR